MVVPQTRIELVLLAKLDFESYPLGFYILQQLKMNNLHYKTTLKHLNKYYIADTLADVLKT